MGSWAKRNMVGSPVLLPVLMSTPGKYSVNESIFLGGYASISHKDEGGGGGGEDVTHP